MYSSTCNQLSTHENTCVANKSVMLKQCMYCSYSTVQLTFSVSDFVPFNQANIFYSFHNRTNKTEWEPYSVARKVKGVDIVSIPDRWKAHHLCLMNMMKAYIKWLSDLVVCLYVTLMSI